MVNAARLGSVAQIFNGKTPSKLEQRDAGHPVLKIKDLSDDGSFSGKFGSFIELHLAKRHQERWLRSGDIVLLNSAHNASHVASKLAKISDTAANALPVGEWSVFRARQEAINADYLYFVLRSSNSRKRLREAARGLHLYPKDIANLHIPLPPLDEQRRIVELLERAAGIRRLREQALAKARAIVPALFLDMFGDFDSGSGLPISPLENVAGIGSGITKGRKLNGRPVEDTPYLRVANVQDGFLNLTEIKTIPATNEDRIRYRLQPGDLVMTEGGDPDKLGRAAIWGGEVTDCLHQNHVFRVRPSRKIVLPDYLAAVIGSSYGKAYFLRVAKRTTGIASINRTQLGAFPVPVPPLNLQNAFAARLADLRSIIAQQQRSLAAARELERSLMARLLG